MVNSTAMIAEQRLDRILVLHTEAKVLLLPQNETVGSDWSAFMHTDNI